MFRPPLASRPETAVAGRRRLMLVDPPFTSGHNGHYIGISRSSRSLQPMQTFLEQKGERETVRLATGGARVRAEQVNFE